jgi:hypothetical protein
LSTDLTATQPEEVAADVMIQTGSLFMWGSMAKNHTFDRIFNAPGNEVWIDPWTNHLKAQGVQFQTNAFVTNVNYDMDTKMVTSVSWCNVTDGRCHNETGDIYLIAVPSERFGVLAANSSLYDVDPKLKGIASKFTLSCHPSLFSAHWLILLSLIIDLTVQWMNGVFVYLHRDLPLVNGHVVFMSAPWALTLISARQFWPNYDWSKHGDGKCSGLLSIIISDWFAVGQNVTKPASQCSPDEILQEIAFQINRVYPGTIVRHNIHSWHIDHDIVYFKDQFEATKATMNVSSTTAQHQQEGIHEWNKAIPSSDDHMYLGGLATKQGSPITTEYASFNELPWYKRGLSSLASDPHPHSNMMMNEEPLGVNNAYTWWNRPDGSETEVIILPTSSYICRTAHRFTKWFCLSI